MQERMSVCQFPDQSEFLVELFERRQMRGGGRLRRAKTRVGSYESFRDGRGRGKGVVLL
jgi:hypothetical protein